MPGLIVDWGSVLTSSIRVSFDDWLSRESVDREVFATVMRRLHDEPDSELHRLETGALPQPDFEIALASMLRTTHGESVDPTHLVARMMAGLEPNESMREIVRECHALGWRTVMLSNSWGNSYDEDVLETMFDALLISDRIGLRKPDARAFEAAVDSAGLPAHECIMIDDLKRNIRGAENVGMSGFLYRHGSEAELRDVLALPGTDSR